MLIGAMQACETYGEVHLEQLLPIMENFLNKAPNVAELDAVRQSVLVLIGKLAKHLSSNDQRVANIFNKLLATLTFPSATVQQAVEDCISPLVSKLPQEKVTEATQSLLKRLFSNADFAERHGAAHGIAGIVRGCGIIALKTYGIFDALIQGLDDKKTYKHRESALYGFEKLCLGMGRLFEPYVGRIITGLLAAFGDSNTYVRDAASVCAKAIMSKLSAHGVKLVLPALLKSIDEASSWRARARRFYKITSNNVVPESVSLLGAMTHCAPKQLSSCLPQIVPRLLLITVDSQQQIKEAGQQALSQIVSVIRNPEVQSIVPILKRCLEDPLTDKTPCLLALRDTCFVHVIDAPSLALIMPIIRRAFDDRSTETRKMAAQIYGNFYSLAKKEDLQPYVADIVPGLKNCLLDPVPEVRSVAARALGAMVRGMGETSFKDLLPWLMQTLTTENSSVNRSGAAQGLAEVLGGMGLDRLRSILPELILTASSSGNAKIQPHVRDGYLMLLIYLPMVFQNSFIEFVGPVIPAILKGLADETEYLRETALKAGQGIVQLFAETSVELLLPELELGLGDASWRIRHSSIQLMGDLLYKLGGTSAELGTMAPEEGSLCTEKIAERIVHALGQERRDRVLARLHIARSDPVLVVRHSAIHVWKIVVNNTVRTLRSIMPTLVKLILQLLGSAAREQQMSAARALGEVLRLGRQILPEIVPILEAGLDSPDLDRRKGVCTSLCEIMRSCPREEMGDYIDILVLPIKKALRDSSPEVRKAAARAFDILYQSAGVSVLEQVLPEIVVRMDASLIPEDLSEEQRLEAENECDNALDALRCLLQLNAKVIMPSLLPKLTQPKVNAQVFASLAAVAGSALAKYIPKLLPALLITIIHCQVPISPEWLLKDSNHK
ncbi:eIF-2-alpha kinase activator GCN1 [Cichlidogyrus casuarinus]|uniref:EIF-2-alpha kinase activator GCN1 n=1 Tax=Cichlidogyrus casuarinus TaxID=1844966 RepID=A0ABD2QP95_9PLAT